MRHAKENSRGFSVAELTIAMAIFFVITAMVTINQGRFAGKIQVSNLAYDVGLAIRQAQVYGLGVRGSSGNAFQNTYGIHFFSTPSNYFVLFVDNPTTDNNGRYNVSSNNSIGCISNPLSGYPECVSFFKMRSGFTVKKFCVNGTDCSDGSGNPLVSMDVTFKRPEPEPNIKVVRYNGQINEGFTNASITISSAEGLEKTVNVHTSGQISVQ